MIVCSIDYSKEEDMNALIIKINKADNVAIAVEDIAKGTKINDDLTALDDIPQAHKIALRDCPKGTEIIRYGVPIGTAACNIKMGNRVNESNLLLPEAPGLDKLQFAVNTQVELPKPDRLTWLGYRNKSGEYGGTRNVLAIHTTVQCVSGIVNEALQRIKKEILPKYPHVDDAVAITHSYGCGVAIDAPDADIPQRILQNITLNPNFGDEFMLVSLGCEKFSPERFCEPFPERNNKDNVLVLQEIQGYGAMIESIMRMAEKKLQKLDQRRREELPLSKLLIGMQCGGSDAFSGITSNPTAGYAADLLTAGGGTALFSEVTEARDGIQFVAKRCIDDKTGQRLVQEMRWYDEYLRRGGVGREANTTPGNKKGGLSNIVEKSMGSIAKSGRSPIVEVLSPGMRPSSHGMIFAATPASDFFCGSCQMASGIGLELFMTGRGTTYSLPAVPVIKICSRSEMKQQWSDVIDYNAGCAAKGGKTIEQQGEELFHYILDVASGTERTYAEQHGTVNDICIFNPAPIT